MENTYTKIDEVTFEKTIVQPDLVIKSTLDDLLAEQTSLEIGIKNNQDRITEQQAKLDEVLAEIATVKGLGIIQKIEPVVEPTQEDIKPTQIIDNLPIKEIIN